MKSEYEGASLLQMEVLQWNIYINILYDFRIYYITYMLYDSV